MQPLHPQVGATEEPLSDEEQHAVHPLPRSDSSRSVDCLDVGTTHMNPQHTREAGQVHTALSLQDKFSPEILAEIFLHCKSDDPILLPPDRLSDLPWVLLHVCWKWRQIVLSLRGLWAFSTLPGFWSMSRSRPQTAHAIMSTIQHSTIALFMSERDLAYVFEFLKQHSSRVDTFSFLGSSGYSKRLPPQWVPPLFLQNMKYTYPSLVNLELLILSRVSEFPPSNFEAAPNLRRVLCSHHSGSPVCLTHRLFSLPWSQLTHLTLHLSPTPLSLFKVLSQCSSLVEFSLENNPSAVVLMGTDSLPTILLQHLQKITFNETPTEVFDMYLHALVAPSLTTLSISPHYQDLWVPRELIAMIDRSGCLLHTFELGELHASIIDEEGILCMLKAMPALVELHLSVVYDISNLVLDAMIRGDLVPQLESLFLQLFGPDATTSALSVISLLESRAPTNDYGPGYKGITSTYVEVETTDALFDILQIEIDALDTKIKQHARFNFF